MALGPPSPEPPIQTGRPATAYFFSSRWHRLPGSWVAGAGSHLLVLDRFARRVWRVAKTPVAPNVSVERLTSFGALPEGWPNSSFEIDRALRRRCAEETQGNAGRGISFRSQPAQGPAPPICSMKLTSLPRVATPPCPPHSRGTVAGRDRRSRPLVSAATPETVSLPRVGGQLISRAVRQPERTLEWLETGGFS